jgi:PrtD family type I secretion system ABC transporter
MRKYRKNTDVRTPLSALGGLKGICISLLVISGVVNVLALTGSFYMMQVYDRALTSHSLPTLVALSVLALGLFAFHGALDVIRGKILARMGARLDKNLAPDVHRVSVDMPRYGFSSAEAAERGRDVDVMRSFLGGQGPIALFDLPWLPIFILFVYLLHPWLGFLTIGGSLVLIVLTILTEVLLQRESAETHKSAVVRASTIDSHARNSEIIRALGMTTRAVERFELANSAHLAAQIRSHGITGTFGGMSKIFRMVLQSAVLGLGAYLTIKGEMTAGAIIAASVAAGRALAPVDLAISQWKGLVAARKSYGRLTETLKALDTAPPAVTLPSPSKTLSVEKITVTAPGAGMVVLSDVSFEVAAGQAVGIIGPSGGGKSSLARALVSVWPLLRGNIRLDEADVTHWSPDVLGASIGYLPQDVALMDGTIAENIARLAPQIDHKAVLAAATAAGVHEMIVRLPDGYDTHLGPMGTALSAGQRQRIALARALYGNPFLVVLDEPNSNLDAAGEAALTAAIKGIRQRKGIAIVIAHRPSALAAIDLVGIVQGGRLTAFGPKESIFNQNLEAVPAPRSLERPAA